MKSTGLFILLFTLLLPFREVTGAVFISAEQETIASEINEDTYIAAGEITVNAGVVGDLICAGGKIIVNDTIAEDLMMAGGELMIKGVVNDDVRAAGGKMDFMGEVGGDLIIFGGEIRLHESSVVNGDVIIYGGKVDVSGKVNGAVKVYGGEVQMNGEQLGILTVKAGKVFLNGTMRSASFITAEAIELGNNCRFFGDVEYWSEQGELDFAKAMENGGKAIFNPDLKYNDERGLTYLMLGAGAIAFLLIYAVSMLVLLIVLQLLLKPIFANAIEFWKKEYVRSFGIGTLYIIGTPVVALLLMALIIGIPIGVFVLINYGFSMFLSHLVAALLITNLLKERYSPDWNNVIVILIAFVITIVIKLVSLVPIAGWLFGFILSAMALGSIILYVKSLFPKKSKS